MASTRDARTFRSPTPVERSPQSWRKHSVTERTRWCSRRRWRRARDTAAIAGFPDAVVDDDLREWDYGDYEGCTTSEIRRSDDADWLLWDDGVPNGETLADVSARADRVIARVRAIDGDVLAFAHGHLLRVLASRWLDVDPGFGRHLALSPATLSVLAWEHHVPAIEAWNAPLA